MEASMFFTVLAILALFFSVFFHQFLQNKKNADQEDTQLDIGMILYRKPQSRSPEKFIVVRKGLNYFHLKSESSGEQILVSEKKLSQEYQPEV